MRLPWDLLERTHNFPGRVQFLLQDWSLLDTKQGVFSHSAITLLAHAFSPLKLCSARQITILYIIITLRILFINILHIEQIVKRGIISIRYIFNILPLFNGLIYFISTIICYINLDKLSIRKRLK